MYYITYTVHKCYTTIIFSLFTKSVAYKQAYENKNVEKYWQGSPLESTESSKRK